MDFLEKKNGIIFESSAFYQSVGRGLTIFFYVTESVICKL